MASPIETRKIYVCSNAGTPAFGVLMPKLVTRIVALVLLPCLVTDLLFASALSNPLSLGTIGTMRPCTDGPASSERKGCWGGPAAQGVRGDIFNSQSLSPASAVPSSNSFSKASEEVAEETANQLRNSGISAATPPESLLQPLLLNSEQLLVWQARRQEEAKLREMIRSELADRAEYLSPSWEDILFHLVKFNFVQMPDLHKEFHRFYYDPVALESMFSKPALKVEIPSPIPFHPGWLPSDLQETELDLSPVDEKLASLCRLIQSVVKEQSFDNSLFLLGSTLVGKPLADVDVLVSESANASDPLTINRLSTELVRVLKGRGRWIKRGIVDHAWGVWAIEETVTKYGAAVRITPEKVFIITTRTPAAAASESSPTENHIQESRAGREAA